MRWAALFALAALGAVENGCAHGPRDFLPEPGDYRVQWDGESACVVSVTAQADERVLEFQGDAGPCSGVSETWRLTETGLEQVESKRLLLPAHIAVGARWTSAGRAQDACVLVREVLAVTAERVEVEERGYCDGKPVSQRVLAHWLVRRGRVLEEFTGGRWRRMTRVGDLRAETGERAVGAQTDGGVPP